MFYFCISVDSSVVLRPLPAPRLGWQCPKAILPTQARILYKAPLFLQLSIINKIPSIVQSSPVLVSQFLPLDQVAIIADHFMNILPTSMIVYNVGQIQAPSFRCAIFCDMSTDNVTWSPFGYCNLLIIIFNTPFCRNELIIYQICSHTDTG